MASSASILPPSLANEKNHSLIRVGSCYFGGEGTIKLECGPMPNLMVALPNIGGALCSTPKSLADAHY